MLSDWEKDISNSNLPGKQRKAPCNALSSVFEM